MCISNSLYGFSTWHRARIGRTHCTVQDNPLWNKLKDVYVPYVTSASFSATLAQTCPMPRAAIHKQLRYTAPGEQQHNHYGSSKPLHPTTKMHTKTCAGKCCSRTPNGQNSMCCTHQPQARVIAIACVVHITYTQVLLQQVRAVHVVVMQLCLCTPSMP